MRSPRSNPPPAGRALACFLAVQLLTTAAAAASEPPKLVIDTQGFAAMVNSLDFSPRADLIAAAGTDKVVRIWEVESGRLKTTLRGYDGKGAEGFCQAVAFSPDGRHLLVGVQDFTSEGAIRVYDAAKLDAVQALLPGHSAGGVSRLAYSTDGRFLASVGADGEVILWSWPDRKVIGRVRVQATGLTYVGFPSRLPILVAYDANGFHAWSAAHASDLSQLSPGQWADLGPRDQVRTALASAQAIGPVLGAVAWPYQGQMNSSRLYPETGVALIGGRGRRDGREVYWAGLWSTRDGQQLRLHEGHRLLVSAEALSADGALAASADVLGDVHLWDTRTGQLRHKFTARGKPIYKVGFSESGRRLAFGTRPFGPDRWGFNNYAALDTSFDLDRRQLDEGAPGEHLTESTRSGERELTLGAENSRHLISSTSGGRVESRYPFPAGIIPQCYGLLRTTRAGFTDPAVFGKNDNSMAVYDPRTMAQRREFIGHFGAVNCFGESPDGLLLVSGSDDRTVRFWALTGFKKDAWPDFDSAGDSVINYLIPGGESERAGILPGDRFVKMDGKEIGSLGGEYLAGRWPYQDGQRVVLDMERGGRPYQLTVPLVAQGDVSEPLLSLFVADDEWIMWTPQGYYDASPHGDRLIGWHVNQGRSKAAKFYLAEQFRKDFYRPDVINQLLKTGNIDRAISAANSARSRSPRPLDLRKPGVLASMEPPTVKLTEPADGARVRNRQVTVSGLVESGNDLPLGDVKVLVNGRPVSGKALARGVGDTDNRRTIDREVPLFPGLNTISVIAANRSATSQPASIRVFCDSAPVKEAKKAYVLAVGISEYARPDFKLDFAHRDAQEFAKAWKTQAGKQHYAAVEARVLTNKDATTAGIRDGMDWLKGNVKPNDLAVVFISAHGLDDGEGGFFVASHEVDPRRLLTTAIPNTDIIRLAEGLRSKVMVFLDTCHAGGILKDSGSRPDAFRDLSSEQVGAIMYGSCPPGGLSQESPRWKHGAFTKAILDSLSDRSCYDDGEMSTSGLAHQIDVRVGRLTAKQQKPVNSGSLNVPSFDFFTYSTEVDSLSLRARRATAGK